MIASLSLFNRWRRGGTDQLNKMLPENDILAGRSSASSVPVCFRGMLWELINVCKLFWDTMITCGIKVWIINWYFALLLLGILDKLFKLIPFPTPPWCSKASFILLLYAPVTDWFGLCQILFQSKDPFSQEGSSCRLEKQECDLW